MKIKAAKGSISSLQLAMLMFISKVTIIFSFLYNSIQGAKGYNLLIVTTGVFLLNFILILPIHFLLKRYPGKNLTDAIKEISPKAATIIVAAYGILFLYLTTLSVSNSNYTVQALLTEGQLSPFFVILMVLAMVYCVCKGLEPVARLSVFIGVTAVVVTVFICLTLAPFYEDAMIEPAFTQGIGPVFAIMIGSALQFFEFLIYGMLAPYTRGSKRVSFLGFNVISYIISSAVLLTIYITMGEFADSQTFSFFTAASIAQIGIIRRFDSLYISFWILLATLKSSIYLFLCCKCMQLVFKNRFQRSILVILGALLIIVNLLLSFQLHWLSIIQHPYFVSVLFLLFIILVPLLFIIVDAIKKRRGKTVSEGRKEEGHHEVS